MIPRTVADGTEGDGQKSPANANAIADLYGGEWTTLSLLVSSHHPAVAGRPSRTP